MTRIQLRRDTAANWESVNPVLAEGEIGIDLTNNKFKIGNGVDTYTSLPYASGDAEALTAQSPLEIVDNYSAQITTSDNIAYDTSTGLITTAFTEANEGGWIRFEIPDNLNINALTDYWRFGTKTQNIFNYLNQMYGNSNVIEIVDEDDDLVSRVWYGSGSYRKGVSASQGYYSIVNSNNEIMHHIANATATYQGTSSGNYSQDITIANKRLKYLQIFYTNNGSSNIGVGIFNTGNTNSLSDIRIFTSADDTEGILLEPTVSGKSIKLNVGLGLDVQDGKLALADITPNYKYSNIEPPLTLIEEEGVPYESAIIDTDDNTFSLSGGAATDSMSKQSTSLALHTDSDMRIDKTKLVTSSFHTQAEVSEYTDSYVYTNSVSDMGSNRFNVFMRTPILGFTQPNGIFIPVLYTTGGTIYEVTSISNMAYDSNTGLTTYTLAANNVGDINSSLLNYDECDMVTLQLKDRNDNVNGFRVQFTKCLNGSQLAYANTVTTSTTPYATLLSKINTVVYPCHCNVNSTGSAQMGDIGINTVAEYEHAIYYTPTPLRTVEDFGIKSTKLGLAYDKTIFRVDDAGYLTDIN